MTNKGGVQNLHPLRKLTGGANLAIVRPVRILIAKGKEMKIVKLTGSVKQVAWANSIIDEFLREGLLYQERLEVVACRDNETREKKEFALLCVAETLKLVEGKAFASWWINESAGRSFVLEFRAIADAKKKEAK